MLIYGLQSNGVETHRLRATAVGGRAFSRNLNVLGVQARANPGWRQDTDGGIKTSRSPSSYARTSNARDIFVLSSFLV